MYYPIGLPKRLNFPEADANIRAIVSNTDRILYAILCDDSLSIWYGHPSLPLAQEKRTLKSLVEHGTNNIVEWRPDSSLVVVATNKNVLLYYSIIWEEGESYEQLDSDSPVLRRHSSELYSKDKVPVVSIHPVTKLELLGGITSIVCLRDELMVSTQTGHIQRVSWDGRVNQDYSIDLRRIPFCDDMLVMKAVPLDVPDSSLHIRDMAYSPLLPGFSIVLSDGRAAYLTASSLRFDPNAVQGIWARDLDDAECTAINHKYRSLVFGRKNSEGVVMVVDEATGGLELCHRLALT